MASDTPEDGMALSRLIRKVKRKPASRRTKKKNTSAKDTAHDALSREAVMTLVAIMKEQEDPRLQLAAAKTLLQRGGSDADREEPDQAMIGEDDIDALIAAAKAILDELARRKAQGVDGAGRVDPQGAPRADHPAG